MVEPLSPTPSPSAETAGRPVPPDDLLALCAEALTAAERLGETARVALTSLVAGEGGADPAKLEAHQYAAHGYAWLVTYVAALREMLAWAERLKAGGTLGELETLMLRAAFGEYLSQLAQGIPMNQGEIVRPADMGLDDAAIDAFRSPAVRRLAAEGNTNGVRMAIAEHIADGAFGADGLDETLSLVRDQFRRFAEERVVPGAHDWHLKDVLIPLEVIAEMAELGVFGLTVPEEHGGLGMGKTAMCVVTEELSAAYIGVGSLGTRSEIAGELLVLFGTDDQRARWLPGIVDGSILPTAVFTEPNIGSDLGSLRTRAVKDGDVFRVTGNKTWITHAARADVMTLLARTNPEEKGHRGLSMFFAPKPRGTDTEPFPAAGMTGGEIGVLGYRGMKEFEIGFDGFEVPAGDLLGEVEGQGFRQLMATFESARIQTAARAVGVARSALGIGLAYARERVQFGKPIFAFPRVSGKLAWMAVETMIARQLTQFAARQKDFGRRCDIEAGMAKLLAARIAWANADNAVQIHGGNGYAQEYAISRVLCDARILNIFEGTAEIQAHIIARGLLTRRN